MVLKSNSWRCVLLVILLSVLQEDVRATTDVKPVRRVLIFNEVNTAHPGIQLIDEGIRTAFEKSPYKLEVYREYLDTIYFPDEADQQRFRAFYLRKYQTRRPDVIITVGPSPLKFMSEMHQAAFPGVPIVFCLPHWVPETLSLDQDFTGVENDLAALETVETAVHLQPGTKHVVVVGGMAFIDRKFEDATKKQLGLIHDELDISYLTDLAMPDLLERLKRLPDQTIVLFTSLSQDAAGTRFISGAEAGPMIVAASNAPVFSLFDVSINHGEVGGKLSYLREQGRIAGDIVLRILGGEKPQAIPTSRAGTAYIFDSLALKRWGFRESDLPPGSIVLNRRATVWELYKWYIIAGISLILLETLLILGLLWQRRRRALAEGKVKESEARFRTVADTAPVLIWMSGTDKLVIYCNKPWLEFTGRSMEQELGNGWAEGVHPDDLKKCLSTYTQSFDRREAFRMEYRLRRFDGEYRWVLDFGSPRFHEGRTFVGYIGSVVDVTERKQMEQAVRESEERLRLAAQAGRMFAYSWDAATDAIERSGEAAEILGIDPMQRATGTSVAAMVHPEDKEKLEFALAKLNLDEPHLQVTYRIIRPDGAVVWLQRNSHAYFNQFGELERIVGMIVDVTERKLAEEALSAVSGRLIQAQEQERTRIARELHDNINQRLAMLVIEMDRLKADMPESRADLRERSEELRNRALETSNEIQSISHRLHSSKLEYLGLIAACRGFCKETAEHQKIRIEFRADDVQFTVPRDVSLALFRIMQESLQNAIKHSRAESCKVTLVAAASEVLLTVRDDGIGFDVNAALSSHGLGLISMRERVSLIGGTILITSDPLHGTEIKVRVPVVVSTDTTTLTPNVA